MLTPAELVWVLVGCIIPDLPWVSLKLLLLSEVFNPYLLRLYFTAQASLFFCIFLTAALSLFTTKSTRIFTIVATNTLLHLFIDALQIKWGNGVHFLAPFDWNMFRFDLFWPEHIAVVLFTLFGFIYLATFWTKILASIQVHPQEFIFTNRKKQIMGMFFLFIYLLGPPLFFEPMLRADTYYIKTMSESSSRQGKTVEFDRSNYYSLSKEIRIYSGEKFKIEGEQPVKSGKVSFKGSFSSEDKILSTSYHYHRDYRDFASIIGLLLTCTLLLQSLVLPALKKQKN